MAMGEISAVPANVVTCFLFSAGAGSNGSAFAGTTTRDGGSRCACVKTSGLRVCGRYTRPKPHPGIRNVRHRRRSPRALRRAVRTPEGPLRLLLHRDVGALLVLRDEGAAAAVPHQIPPLQRRQRLQPDRRVRRPRLRDAGDRRPARRPLARHAQGGRVRRHPARARAPRHGDRGTSRVERRTASSRAMPARCRCSTSRSR